MRFNTLIVAMTFIVLTAFACDDACSDHPDCGVMTCVEDLGDTAEYFYYCCDGGGKYILAPASCSTEQRPFGSLVLDPDIDCDIALTDATQSGCPAGSKC